MFIVYVTVYVLSNTCTCTLYIHFSFFTYVGENPLHTFVRHFEHIDYNQHEVMHHHHRVRRSIVGQRHIKLAFSAFDRY